MIKNDVDPILDRFLKAKNEKETEEEMPERTTSIYNLLNKWTRSSNLDDNKGLPYVKKLLGIRTSSIQTDTKKSINYVIAELEDLLAFKAPSPEMDRILYDVQKTAIKEIYEHSTFNFTFFLRRLNFHMKDNIDEKVLKIYAQRHKISVESLEDIKVKKNIYDEKDRIIKRYARIMGDLDFNHVKPFEDAEEISAPSHRSSSKTNSSYRKKENSKEYRISLSL